MPDRQLFPALTTELEFSWEFMHWACIMGIRHEFELGSLTMGWEL